MCCTPNDKAACTSASAAAAFCCGRAYIKSILTRSKMRQAFSMAVRASSAEWMRPSAASLRSSKLCTPMDRRLMPVLRKPWNLSWSNVPGLASSVISASGFSLTKARMPLSSRSMADTENTLGVPPPINMVSMPRPQKWGSSCCKSVSRAWTYASSSSVVLMVCELKSQYGHFCRHQGMWMYKDSGGSAVSWVGFMMGNGGGWRAGSRGRGHWAGSPC